MPTATVYIWCGIVSHPDWSEKDGLASIEDQLNLLPKEVYSLVTGYNTWKPAEADFSYEIFTFEDNSKGFGVQIYHHSTNDYPDQVRIQESLGKIDYILRSVKAQFVLWGLNPENINVCCHTDTME